jgi:formate hydrogenlyase subunit 4
MGYSTVWLNSIIQASLLVIGAPLFTGIAKWVKCHLQCRTAPSIFQPYLNLNKLFRKEVIVASTTSSIFRLVPYLIFSITVVITFIIPVLMKSYAAISIADIIVIIGLLALIRFFLALAGLDTGTSFGGMGASREMFVAVIAEPAIAIIFFAIAMAAGSTNLINIIDFRISYNLLSNPSLILSAMGFALVALAETGRIPVDNPVTHLELTMTHEAMILEYSGKYLALLEWSSQIKLLLYATLLINLFFPWGITNQLTWSSIALSLSIYSSKLIVLIMGLGITETSLAKLRLFRIPYLINMAFLLGFLAVLMHIIIEVG